MKTSKQMPVSGIRIENTISMAVQNRNRNRNAWFLLVIAFVGAAGSIFTFLSMFQPSYHAAAVIPCLAAEFVVCAALAWFSGKWRPVRAVLLLFYGILIYSFWKPFSAGFINIVNAAYKVIFMTDWEYLTLNETYTANYSISVFLILACVPIIYMICYAVLHFRNFFLALIATLPYVEIGFYFGVPADHTFAVMLLAFWCSMAAVQLSGFGTYQSKGQSSSFLRRDNTFFPVSTMRFMVTEKIGIIVLAAVMLICFLTQQILLLCDYQRSDEIKKLRSEAQDFLASVMLDDNGDSSDIWKNLWVNRKSKHNRIVVTLGDEGKRQFQHVPLSDLSFSDLPNGRVYLKYFTGEHYANNSWTIPEEIVYDMNPVFDLFETLQFYPQEFLYPNAMGDAQQTVTLTMQNPSETLGECVPYGFMENDELTFLNDNQFSTFASSYQIVQDQDYEARLLDSFPIYMEGTEIYHNFQSADRQVFNELFDYEQLDPFVLDCVSGNAPSSSEVQKAYLLCRYGYREYVHKQDTQIPDTPAMEQVRTAYAELLDSYHHDTASAADTIAFLQELRETICGTAVYSLAPGRTPSDKDFVEHFLMESRTGFCMHYATAGVILARMAGIPARYCEGYMVDCIDNPTLETTQINGQTTYLLDILDSNAHAWAEIYIEGWGWVPFEFTFTQTVQPEIPVEETEPSTEPTTTSLSDPTTATTAPIHPPVPDPIQNENHVPITIILTILGVFLVIAAIFGLIHLLRNLALSKRSRLFRLHDRNAAAAHIYAYLLRLLSYRGVNIKVQKLQQLIEEGTEKCGALLGEYDLSMAVQIAAKARYSHHTITSEELHYLLQTSRTLARNLYQNAAIPERLKLKFILHFV